MLFTVITDLSGQEFISDDDNLCAEVQCCSQSNLDFTCTRQIFGITCEVMQVRILLMHRVAHDGCGVLVQVDTSCGKQVQMHFRNGNLNA